ncbi:MAG: hypothetical protein SGJ27_30490 [Candidatus Melainabacteria bacterium]|nr:hypothetical protein [Candidatus Melainabacteria bacterium]
MARDKELTEEAQNSQPVADPLRHGIRFGEFLAALDALQPEDLAGALMASKQLGIPLGRTLVVRRLVSNEDLGRLLEFHGLYRRNLCDFDQVREAFNLSKVQGLNVKEALGAIGLAVDEIESVRLGELLLAAQLVDVNQLNNALSLQNLCGLPLGRVLCIHFNFPPEIIDAALNFQTSIRQKTLSYVDAVDQLKIMPLELNSPAMKLAIELDFRDLLIAGKVCSESDVQTATNFALANNLPLEQVLAGFTWIDPALVSATLGLSKLVDGGYITGYEAVNFLTNTDLSKKKSGDDGSENLNLHKFLLACGFLTPQDIKEIARLIVSRKKEFGEIVGRTIDDTTPKDELQNLVFQTFSSDALLAALLSKMFGSDELVIAHARNLVDLLSINGASVEQAILSFAAIRRDVARFSAAN